MLLKKSNKAVKNKRNDKRLYNNDKYDYVASVPLVIVIIYIIYIYLHNATVQSGSGLNIKTWTA